MSKALEAARKAIEAHPAYDCGSTGDEEMARAAITAYLAHLAEDEEVVERVARAIEPHMPAQVKYWQEGGMMRAKLIGPYDPEYVSPLPAARAALRSLSGKE